MRVFNEEMYFHFIGEVFLYSCLQMAPGNAWGGLVAPWVGMVALWVSLVAPGAAWPL
jgi:hypothetical protein